MTKVEEPPPGSIYLEGISCRFCRTNQSIRNETDRKRWIGEDGEYRCPSCKEKRLDFKINIYVD